VDASPRVARNNCAVGPGVQRLDACELSYYCSLAVLRATSAHRAPSGAYAARACPLCIVQYCMPVPGIYRHTDGCCRDDRQPDWVVIGAGFNAALP
jgi:hypothetical protein